ncbi:hypothetical protein M6B38_390740 [Iris pallida]|uniref:Uncharacterized protein n=1 Tax=Iris pallida TaxID=29817 RepID=A0AAX6G028_IRIPA|nr:hypothetical protein M6B38_390740 [Iris pallida]
MSAQKHMYKLIICGPSKKMEMHLCWGSSYCQVLLYMKESTTESLEAMEVLEMLHWIPLTYFIILQANADEGDYSTYYGPDDVVGLDLETLVQQGLAPPDETLPIV